MLPIGVWINNDATTEYQQYLLPARATRDVRRSTHLRIFAASPGRLEKHQDSGPAIFPELNPEVLITAGHCQKRPKRRPMARIDSRNAAGTIEL